MSQPVIMGITSLPVEIVVKIVHMATCQHNRDIVPALVNMSGVCRVFNQAFLQVLAQLRHIRMYPGEKNYSNNSNTIWEPRGDSVPQSVKVKDVVRRCPALQSLDLVADSRETLTWDVLAGVTASCTQLVSLSISYGLFCDAFIEYGQFASLQVLSIRHCRADWYDGLSPLLFPVLTHLDASWTQKIHASVLEHLAPQLETLVLRGCAAVNNDIIPFVARCQLLDLGATGVTDEGLLNLAQAAPGLRCLHLAMRHANVWSDGEWSERGLLRFQEQAPHVAVCHTFDPAPLPDWRGLVK